MKNLWAFLFMGEGDSLWSVYLDLVVNSSYLLSEVRRGFDFDYLDGHD